MARAEGDHIRSQTIPLASAGILPSDVDVRGPEHINSAPSRAIDGASMEAASIHAVTPSADSRGDNSSEVVNSSPIAQTARASRRGFLMNSIVSAASLASATALAMPDAMAVEGGRHATIARAKHMVEILRDRVVCDGWHEHFDRERAAEFLDAVRREDYSADNDSAQATVTAWVNDHGQSFDWLYCGDPAGLLCNAAEQSPIAAAIPGGADPIFAAIETYIEADEAHGHAIHLYGEAEIAFRDEFGTMTPDAWSKKLRESLATLDPKYDECRTPTHEEVDRYLPMFGPEVVEALHRELDHQITTHNERVKPADDAARDACHAANEAMQDLLNTIPTTKAGLIALLRFVQERRTLAEWLEINGNEDMRDLFDTVSTAVTNLMAA